MRTGSSLLNFTLRDAGIGDAAEYMNVHNPTYDTYDEFARYIKNGNKQTPDVIGWRVMWLHFWTQQDRNRVWANVPVETMFDGVTHAISADTIKYIYLTRRDRLRQALSAVRANRGDRWRCPSNEEPHHIEIPFTKKIISYVEWIIDEYPKYEARWEAYFSERGIDPLRLVYEDMTASDTAIRETLDRIGDYIGVNVPPVAIPLRKQAGTDVEDWIEHYEHLSLGK
jgi:LPS sulfotransferase NodH